MSSKTLESILLIDLEVSVEDRAIYHIGALLNDKTYQWRSGTTSLSQALKDLTSFAAEARFILGHNIVAHDIPLLKSLCPELPLLNLAPIDTLTLSPLAFPENPYHRLVKDYKIVRHSKNNPVSDARLAGSIFVDQLAAFGQLAKNKPDLLAWFRFCLRGQSPAYDELFSSLGVETLQNSCQHFSRLIDGLGCISHLSAYEAHFSQYGFKDLRFAYLASYLHVAGGNAVLPPWVRGQYPQLYHDVLHLRERRCDAPTCRYCQNVLGPRQYLQRYFNYDDFRLVEGKPLQRNIIDATLEGKSSLALLATGGGKSLCFQIPAMMRYHSRGALTVVISPLQALMKDQVDGLRKSTGFQGVATVNGSLTLPERGQVLERVRLGDIAILYISPEQLRNHSIRSALAQREVVTWVFDEAHCLAKWGHDFRTDYLFAGRFIRDFCQETQGDKPIQVTCLTATAKLDVITEIKDYFSKELRLSLELFASTIERENLNYSVVQSNESQRNDTVEGLLRHYLLGCENSAAVVFCSTKKKTEELARYLKSKEFNVAPFHAGLNSEEKKTTLEGFIANEIDVVCATNAFGMGIDKANIRVVIHADIPGSLENYLQEAGRAGRDQQSADCILLYDERAIDGQFGLSQMGRIEREDINEILRTLKRRDKKQKDGTSIIFTPEELLRDKCAEIDIDADDSSAQTKVKVAISWLEREGFLTRSYNHNQVFQGKPTCPDLATAEQKMLSLNLSTHNKEIWLSLLKTMLNNDQAATGNGLSADHLAESIGEYASSAQESLTGKDIMGHFSDMASAGIIEQGIQLSARLPKGKRSHLALFHQLENKLFSILREESPDMESGKAYPLNIIRINQRLLDEQFSNTDPSQLRMIFELWSHDGSGIGAQRSTCVIFDMPNRIKLTFNYDWEQAGQRIFQGQALANATYEFLYRLNEDQAPAQALEFSGDTLIAGLKKDITLHMDCGRDVANMERGLLRLHNLGVIILEKGLAIFRQAISVDLADRARGRGYSKGNYEPLKLHYDEKNTQIHIMDDYAKRGMKTMVEAARYVLDYFALARKDFITQYFSDRKELLNLATSAQSYERIVGSLKNDIQHDIVTAAQDSNQLILAGPGSGKTHLIVHRCAYLIRVLRVDPDSIMVLCFNHDAAMELRKRLFNLLGKEAIGLWIHTYHGLAMRLLGRSFSQHNTSKQQTQDKTDTEVFDRILEDATKLLCQEDLVMETEDVRERLLKGFRHILVDEYQDINGKHYALVSAIAGRASNENDKKLTIMAVGDDDQNIYEWMNSSVTYIKQFKDDYRAKLVYLVENYRSTKNIIAAANKFIAINKHRLKVNHPICINQSRFHDEPGEQVTLIGTSNSQEQIQAIVATIKAIRIDDKQADYADIAVLMRSRQSNPLWHGLREALQASEIPLSLPLKNKLSLARIREIHQLIQSLRKQEKKERTVAEIKQAVLSNQAKGKNTWHDHIHAALDYLGHIHGDSALALHEVIEYLYEYCVEHRRDGRLGIGVHLGTLHSAKGLQYRHVILIDEGKWSKALSDEARRLYYVGMTRAQRSLYLICQSSASGQQAIAQSHLYMLANEACCQFQQADTVEQSIVQRTGRYLELGPRDWHMDYCANKPSIDPVHQVLKGLSNDNAQLSFCKKGASIYLHQKSQAVARLSKEGAEKIERFVTSKQPIDMKLIAMLVRLRQDVENPAYAKNIKVDKWYYPIIDVFLPHDFSSSTSRSLSQI